MSREYLQQFLVVAPGHIIAAQMGIGVGAVEECGRILCLVLEDESILIDGILPLLQFKVDGSLTQMEVCVPCRQLDLAVEHAQGVAPILRCLSVRHLGLGW